MTANTTFTVGQVLTSAQANNFPFGVVGRQTLTTTFTTVSSHLTFQDNGMTLTIPEISGRIYRITAYSNPYPSGGDQQVLFRILRSGVSLKQGNYGADVMDAAIALPIVLTYVYQSVASGNATYKMQIAAGTNNTAVADYGDSTFPRQFVIEDIGSA